MGIIPGGELSGEEANASAWSEVVSDSGTLDLETNPGDPYSVRIRFVFREGNVYIDPAEGRRWYQNLKDDPSVRVRIADRIYRARARAVIDPDELRGFDPDRRPQRLELNR
jgi:nitroimidazol reductase NimA-like FMN-containing flavoprotein (pyridoxamine 5'-phosphate oxidase superfamily)